MTTPDSPERIIADLRSLADALIRDSMETTSSSLDEFADRLAALAGAAPVAWNSERMIEAGAKALLDADRRSHYDREWDRAGPNRKRAYLDQARTCVVAALEAAPHAPAKAREVTDLESDFDTVTQHNIDLQSLILDGIKIHSSFNTTADMADWLRDGLDALATFAEGAE